MRIKVRLEIVEQEIKLIGLANQEKYIINTARELEYLEKESEEDWEIGSFSMSNSFTIDNMEIETLSIDGDKGILRAGNKKKVVKSGSVYLLGTTKSSVKRGVLHNPKRPKNILEQLIFQYEEKTIFRMYPLDNGCKMFILNNDGNKSSTLISDTNINVSEINSDTSLATVGFNPTVIVNLNYSKEYDSMLIELYTDLPMSTLCTDLKYFLVINDIKEFLETYLEK